MPAQKRRAPATPEPPPPSTRRRSTRVSSAGNTKSRYFEGDSDASGTEEDELSTPQRVNGAAGKSNKAKRTATSAAKRGRPRGRPAKKAKAESEDEEEEYDDQQTQEESTPEAVPAKKKQAKNGNDNDYDDDGDDDEDPRVTFIPHVKMRDTGGVPYQDDRLHKNTLLFLKDLKANNKRTWLKCTTPNNQSPPARRPLLQRDMAQLTLVARNSQRWRVPPLPNRLEYLRRETQ